MTSYDGVLLASGGMDSTVLAYKLAQEKKNILLLFFNYGQHCADKEYNTLTKIVPPQFSNNIRTINISDIYQNSNSRLIKEANLWVDNITSDDLHLPHRNLLFLTAASAYARSNGINDIYSAFIDGDRVVEIDSSTKFFSQLEKLLEYDSPINIIMPFIKMSKTQVAKLGLELNAPISMTYSCQVNSQNPCGACSNCVDRLEAFNNLFKDNK